MGAAGSVTHRFRYAPVLPPVRLVPLPYQWPILNATTSSLYGRRCTRSNLDEARTGESTGAALAGYGLVYLFPFRIGFALAEVFVIIRETIHEQPEKADEARAH